MAGGTHTRPLAGQAARFAAAGAIVGLIYIGLTLLISGPVGAPIQLAIPVAYALAVALHFALQRSFVFRHGERFALSAAAQARRYVGIAAIQYPTTALSTALLPDLLGISEQLAYVVTVVVISALTFLFLRHRVFHTS